jgi:hypothetical protein
MGGREAQIIRDKSQNLHSKRTVTETNWLLLHDVSQSMPHHDVPLLVVICNDTL